jgi:chemotaxis protein methyltransferase CheR
LNARTGLANGLAVEELEVELLLEALFQRHGFDFRDYDRALLKRKLRAVMQERSLATVSALQERVLHEPDAASGVLRALAVAPAGMFDEPQQARQMRAILGASLRASPVPRVWVAECAGVGEAWSLAILLDQEQVLARTEIYATLANEELLAETREASLPAAQLPAFQEKFLESGGSGKLDAYFDIRDDRAVLDARLASRINWSQYNLVTDASFNEFQAIICCRALPDFGPVLRQRVLRLFHDSLALFGVLRIDRELARSEGLASSYQPIVPGQPWYKRVA